MGNTRLNSRKWPLCMGDDSGIRVAEGPWLPDAESGLISTNLWSAYANSTVCDLMFPKNNIRTLI